MTIFESPIFNMHGLKWYLNITGNAVFISLLTFPTTLSRICLLYKVKLKEKSDYIDMDVTFLTNENQNCKLRKASKES